MTLLRPTDTELKLDLQKYEDLLTIVSVIVAREHAKIEVITFLNNVACKKKKMLKKENSSKKLNLAFTLRFHS